MNYEYTKEIPTKEGWYWVRKLNREKPTEVIGRIYKGVGRELLIETPLWVGLATKEADYEYAGPIERPKDCL